MTEAEIAAEQVRLLREALAAIPISTCTNQRVRYINGRTEEEWLVWHRRVPLAFPLRTRRPAVTCGHPERPYGAKGRCKPCYDHWYHAPRVEAARQAVIRRHLARIA